MLIKRIVLLLTVAAMLALMVVVSAAPAIAQDFPWWCYDEAYKAAAAQSTSWEQVNYECTPALRHW